MAITLKYSDIVSKYNPNHWDSIDEFEEYYLSSILEHQPDTLYYINRDGIEEVIPSVNHNPLIQYDVWMEGYLATGEHGEAHLAGSTYARNFAQACHIVMAKKFLEETEEINKLEHKGYVAPGRWDYNPSSLTYWGCKLYPTEKLARKTFG